MVPCKPAAARTLPERRAGGGWFGRHVMESLQFMNGDPVAKGGAGLASHKCSINAPMATGSDDLHVLLTGDHQRLEQIFRELENAVEGADQPTIQHDWGDFERGVLTHFEAEERLIFPLLESEHPAEVERAKKDHEVVRALLASLGVRTDLHLLRKDVADELIARLREHAEWEDRTLYPWAQRTAREETHRSLRELLLMHPGT